MIIKRIEIENFLSYYGKNQIDFDLGPTIIIGQNNTGKSKLFDAFNWALYDLAFKTREEQWLSTKDWGPELINNHAKKEAKVGSTIDCSVSILFFDEKNDKYYLTREYSVKKKNENDFDFPKKSELSLSVTENITKNNKNYYDNEAREHLISIFPENLSKYFLFQGENINQIMSLNNKSAFTNALRDLSRIKVFELAKSYTEKVFRKLRKEFEDKEDSDKVLQDQKKKLSSEIDKGKDDLDHQEELFDNECKERDIAKSLYEQRNEELKKYRECADIIKQIEQLEYQRSLKNEVRENLLDSQKKDVFDKWMYAGTDIVFKRFLQFYNKNKIEKKIPEPIRQEFIKEMLSDEICKVCGTSAPKGSPEYEKIKLLLNDKSLDTEIETINQLSMAVDTMLDKVNNIKPEISDFYQRIEKIDTEIKDLQTRIKVKDDELASVIPSDVNSDEVKKKNFVQLQEDRDNCKRDWDRYESRINQIKGKKEFIQNQLKEKQEEYDSLIESSSNILEKERLLLAEKIQTSTSQFYSVFLDKLIRDIESEANTCFKNMTEKNAALSGLVKVDYANQEVYTTDEHGHRLYNINQANKVSLQMAFVAAVLSVSNKFWNTYFPFIADAPISALGGNNKLTTIETMIDIFNQSIIILKDDAVTEDLDSLKKDLIRKLIDSDNKILNAYELRMDGNSLDEQKTKIIKLK